MTTLLIGWLRRRKTPGRIKSFRAKRGCQEPVSHLLERAPGTNRQS
jgi:hypothetical protein